MGRPHEAPRAELDDEAFTADANGNGVEHHDPVKSNSSPSEARKPDTLPAATAAASPVADTALGNGTRRSSKKKPSWSGKLYEEMTEEEKADLQQHTEAAFVATRKGRIFFVRLPTTIPGDSASLQQKRDERVQARKDIEQKSAEIRKKKANRQTYRDLREQSFARLQGCRARVTEAVNELKPYRQERNQERNQRKQLDSEDRAIFAGVQYKSEAELDQAIKVVEDRLAHAGGLPLREEMSLVKEVTRLNGLRPAVRKAEEEAAKKAQARAEAMAQKTEAPSTLSKEEQREREKKLEEERSQRMKERDAEEDLWKKYCAEADALNDEVDALLAERKALSDKLERLEIEMKELQGPLAEASKENRKFSRDVRDIVQAGDIAHARKLCEEQADKLMDWLGKDPVFRRNYIDLWAKQKKEIEEEQLRKGLISQPEHDSAVRPAAKPVVLEKPEDVIASVLRGAAVAAAQTLKERGAAVGAPTKGAKEPAPGPDAADSPPAALANGHASAPEQPETPDFSEPRKTLGAEQMEELAEGSGAPAKAKGPRRSKAEKKAVVEIPAILDDKTPFVPPAALVKRDVAELDEEEERERARLRNAEAAREAEARKERKRRKAEAAKARTAKAKDASKAAAAATADDAVAAKEPTGPEVEELQAAVAAVEVAPVSVMAPGAAVAAAKPSGGGGKSAGRVGKHIGAPVAKSRLLVNRKKGALQRAWAFINQHLPKSLVYKLLLVGVVGLLAIWLLVEVLPRGIRA